MTTDIIDWHKVAARFLCDLKESDDEYENFTDGPDVRLVASNGICGRAEHKENLNSFQPGRAHLRSVDD